MAFKVYLNKHLLLDGYNVLNAVPELKKQMITSLEDGREFLNELLKEYSALTGEHVVVVYDAYRGKSKTTTVHKYKQLKIVYTKENETADSYIEMLAEDLSQNKRNLVRVVTSDWAEQQIVLGSGAARVAPLEFYQDYLNLKRNLKTEFAHKPAFATLEGRLPNDVVEALEKMRKN